MNNPKLKQIFNREALSILARQNLLGKPYFWADYPGCLQISTNNICTSKTKVLCKYCYPQHKIAVGDDYEDQLCMETIRWILKDIGKYGKYLNFYTLFLDNDMCGDERLPEILRMGKKYAPGKTNQTFSCGAVPELAHLACDRNLDWFCVTLSASNRELYKQVHGGNRFDDVLKFMRYVTEHRHSNQRLEVHYVITETNFGGMRDWWELMGKEFPDWKRVFSPLVASYDNVWSNSAMGNLSMTDQVNAIRAIDYESRFWDPLTTSLNQPCVLWNNASVNAHGTLLQCCNWADSKLHNYGNVKEYMDEGRSIRDYWQERLANKQRNNLCRNCNLRRADYQQRLSRIRTYHKLQL